MVCARNSVHHRHRPLLVAADLPQYPVDGVLLHVHVEQQRRPRQYWSRKHKVERPCGTRAAIASSEYGVHLTSASVRASNYPTKHVMRSFRRIVSRWLSPWTNRATGKSPAARSLKQIT
jgi:hypothetical protein